MKQQVLQQIDPALPLGDRPRLGRGVVAGRAERRRERQAELGLEALGQRLLESREGQSTEIDLHPIELDGEPRDVELIEHLWAGGYVPVVNTLGIAAKAEPGQACEVYNINADTVAAAIAASLAVEHLFLVTDVPGVLRDVRDPGSRIPTLSQAQAEAAIADGTISGGMIPKVEEALGNLARGVGAVHILGAARGALREAATNPGARGTVFLGGAGRAP